jgi:hypothetical protein
MRNVPVELEVVLRVRPVAAFRAVTVAPGTIARVSSRTRPSITPVLTWAHAGAERPNATAQAATAHRRCLAFIPITSTGLGSDTASVDLDLAVAFGCSWSSKYANSLPVVN